MASVEQPVVIRQSRGKLLIGVLGCFAFLVIGAWMYTSNTPHGLRWIIGVYFGGGIARG